MRRQCMSVAWKVLSWIVPVLLPLLVVVLGLEPESAVHFDVGGAVVRQKYVQSSQGLSNRSWRE